MLRRTLAENPCNIEKSQHIGDSPFRNGLILVRHSNEINELRDLKVGVPHNPHVVP